MIHQDYLGFAYAPRRYGVYQNFNALVLAANLSTAFHCLSKDKGLQSIRQLLDTFLITGQPITGHPFMLKRAKADWTFFCTDERGLVIRSCHIKGLRLNEAAASAMNYFIYQTLSFRDVETELGPEGILAATQNSQLSKIASLRVLP